MSQHLAELCTLLVRETFGELPSRVIATLFLHGRLSIPAIIHNSKLPPRHVTHGLAILLQQRLLYYHTSHDDGQTYYEVHLLNTYDIARYGRSARQVEESFGQNAADLVSLLEHYGYANAAEIFDRMNEKLRGEFASDERSYVNGSTATDSDAVEKRDQSKHQQTLEQRLESVRPLFLSRHVVEVTDQDFMAPAEYQEMVEENVRTNQFHGEVKGRKRAAEFQLAILKMKAQWLDANTATFEQLEAGVKQAKLATDPTANTRKRNAPVETNGDSVHSNEVANADDRRPNKRPKTDEKESNVDEDKISSTAHDGFLERNINRNTNPSFGADQRKLAFRLNRDKFNVAFRSQRLVDFVARSFGESIAQVYRSLLRVLERHIPRCHDEYSEAMKKARPENVEGEDLGYGSDDDESHSATCMEVEKDLDPALDLQSIFNIDKQPKVKVEGGQENGTSIDEEPRSLTNGVTKDLHESSASFLKRQKRIRAIDQHLRLISEHFLHFCTRTSGRGYGCYTVNFRTIIRSLTQYEVEALIMARFGLVATRIIRILQSKGKLDEKQLASVGLVRQKELRRLLTLMQESGFVDTQEIPRDGSRQPSRTIYLWFYDQDRCRKLVLNDTYKAMSRLLQRAHVEQEKVQSVIDKAERTDVKGQEEKYLSQAEQEALAEWRETKEKLLVQLFRQDDLVALLRDFQPTGS